MNIQKRVEQSRVTEKEYRQLKSHLNYSALKTFSTNRKAFYKEYVLGESREEKTTVATIMGSLVHSLLGGDFDDKFVIGIATEPTGQMLQLVDALYARTLKSLDQNGVQTERFEQLFMDAVNDVKYDFNMKEVAFKGKTLEKIVEMFSGSDSETWYKEKLNAIGKQIVSINSIQQAEKLVEKLRNHPYTAAIVNQQSTDDIEVFNELPILFKIDGVEFRSLVDKLMVNHNDKTVKVIDYKTGWSIEDGGFERSYTKNCYYLQVALYSKAAHAFKEEHGLEGYKVIPMTYITIDTTGWLDPIIYQCTEEDVIYGWEGFKLHQYTYQGAAEIISTIAWHLGTGNWVASKETVEANGILPLSIQYS